MEVLQAPLTSKANRPALRRKDRFILSVKGVVVHWTANVHKGADAVANRNYFDRKFRTYAGRYFESNWMPFRWGSAHYIVDDKRILQCIPDNEVAYHCGDGNIKKFPESPNMWLLGVEMCVNKDGDWLRTISNTKILVNYLQSKYKVPVYRHYDITGKNCPKMFLPTKVGSEQYDWSWEMFKEYLKQ